MRTTERQKYVSKTWGFENWITNTEKYCCKILFVKRDRFCSVHYHKLKDETFYVQSGEILLEYSFNEDHFRFPGGRRSSMRLSPGDSFHIEPGLIHRFTGLQDSVIVETSTQHFEEDSYRLIPGSPAS